MTTSNEKLNALIARLEGGELLTRNFDGEIRAVINPPGPGCYWEEGPPYFATSFDAVMSLARNQYEVWRLLEGAAFAIEDCRFSGDTESQPVDLKPMLRAMLIEVLRWRRT